MHFSRHEFEEFDFSIKSANRKYFRENSFENCQVFRWSFAFFAKIVSESAENRRRDDVEKMCSIVFCGLERNDVSW